MKLRSLATSVGFVALSTAPGLAQTGATPPSGDPRAAFEAAFPLPKSIVDALRQTIDSVLGGI